MASDFPSITSTDQLTRNSRTLDRIFVHSIHLRGKHSLRKMRQEVMQIYNLAENQDCRALGVTAALRQLL